MAINGRGPNGRALNKDGSERKARATKTFEETMAAIAENERKAYATVGRRIMANAKDMVSFVSGLSTFKRWVKECRSYSDAEKRAAQRDRLQAKIDAIDAKGVIAEEYLPTTDSAVEVINGLYSSIGEGYQKLFKVGEATPENVSEMVRNAISQDVQDIVESANDPDNDPYSEYRRGADSTPEDTEDTDTL